LYGYEKFDFLKKFSSFGHGIPSHDTFARVFTLINPKQFNLCFIKWVEFLHADVKKMIGIDGKKLRQSYTNRAKSDPLYTLNAFSTNARLALGQQIVDSKSNEITAIPKLLDLLVIKGAIISLDAMGCQKDITKKIADNKADYVIALKGNQGSLLDEVKTFFLEEEKNSFKEVQYDYFKNVDKAHGRIEARECWCTSNINWIHNGKEWAKLNTIAMVRSKRIINGKETIENRFFISSLPAQAELITNVVRRHWAIENSLHWVLDVTFSEDGSRIRKKTAAENMAIVRKIALNAVNLTKEKKISIKNFRLKAGWNNNHLVRVLQNI
jgi:predicted transposase YbfD/YdcC